ncbi:MAG: CpsD/CapB family tyrosine-protein kinase [Syntrophomonas sp.]
MQMKSFNVYDEENIAVKDAYALLMANVHFSSKKEEPIKNVTICSCEPGAGKTTIAINLAISMARSGWKILLVDTDIRKPGNFKRLNNGTNLGLSNIIVDGINLQDALTATNIANLSYLSCGKSVNNAIEMLCSVKLNQFMAESQKQYDFVLFDTPALSTVIDGALVASKTDGVILIAEIGTTKLTALNRAKQQLEKADANIMGVVLTRVKKRDYIKYVESYNYFERFNRAT